MKLNRKFYKVNKTLHRDIGYFFVFMTLIYCVSGLALNHADDWNPDYYVRDESYELKLPATSDKIDETILKTELERLGEDDGYLMYDVPTNDKIKVYFKNGSMLCNLHTQTAELERVTKRFLIFDSNYLHRNPSRLWTWFSDIYTVGLLILALSGLFIAKGKYSLKRRGVWFVSSGILLTFIVIFTI